MYSLYIKPGLSLGWTQSCESGSAASQERCSWGGCRQGKSFKNCPSCSALLCSMFLQDDSPPLYPTSPGPVPITLAMDHVVVRRRDDGVFYLTGQ